MLQFDSYATLIAAIFVLLLGRMLVNHVEVLRTFNIPKPVAGGLIVAMVILLLRYFFEMELRFDTSMQTPLMLAFFAAIGLSADVATLRSGGKAVIMFLVVVAGLLVVQNTLGVGLAKILGLEPHMGLLAGSITLSGGHGTGAAWSATFADKYNVQSAAELALACATFGLVLGGIIGGPVARYLVSKVEVPGAQYNESEVPQGFEMPDSERPLTTMNLIETLGMIIVCLKCGELLAQYLKGSMLELPVFVCVLFFGGVLRNILTYSKLREVSDRQVSLFGNVSLSLFLAMALMSLKLWDLARLALPIFILLFAQTAAMALYAIFVTFRVMGKNYDAAVLAAGHCGFGLGATPTAIANMQAVTHHFGPSHLAFLVVPMVGAFFIDIINAVAIKLFLALPFLQ
ncbi:MAG: sodium/glutamate symporter [Enterovibrio sp.]